MSLFKSILKKLGIGKDEAPAAVVPPPVVEALNPVEIIAAAPAPIPVVDVVAQLEEMAAKHPEKLNWKTSIVDLHKLLGLDHSYAARKELAIELGVPQEKLADSAQMNIWLHKTVLAKIAENGGNIPQDLLD